MQWQCYKSLSILVTITTPLPLGYYNATDTECELKCWHVYCHLTG